MEVIQAETAGGLTGDLARSRRAGCGPGGGWGVSCAGLLPSDGDVYRVTGPRVAHSAWVSHLYYPGVRAACPTRVTSRMNSDGMCKHGT